MQQKRRRLVAETADDLQQILFGDIDETEVPDQEPTSGEQQALVPALRPEAEDMEVLSDSDRDSMDDFIVRDTGDDREHRFVSEYSVKYGDDVAEGLNDVIAIFGDLRILDIYSQGEFSRVKRIVDEKAPLETRFDPEEVAAQLASSRDELILTSDAPERFQEEYGTERVMTSLNIFNSKEEIDQLEAEWASEATWLAAILSQQYRQRSKQDWSLWSPAKLEDDEAKPPSIPKEEEPQWHYYPEQLSEVVKRFQVFLRDLKGRGMDPLLIWYSMARVKYSANLTLVDLQNAQLLDIEWTKLWSKRSNIESKLMQLLAEIDGNLAAMSAEVPTDAADPDAIVSGTSINQALAETAKTDLSNLLAELRFISSREGMGPEFGEYLDDISASISGEIEPVIRYISDPTVGSRTIGTLITNKLHESLVPLLSLSPREAGENLNMGARMNRGPFAGMVAPTLSEDSLSHASRTAVVEFLSSTLSSNLKVRRWFRTELNSKAAIFTHPNGPVVATKRLYGVRRLAGRPVSELFGTEVFLAIQSLVNMGEVSMDLALLMDGKVVVENRTEVPEGYGAQDTDSEDTDPITVKNALNLKAHKELQGETVSQAQLFAPDPLLIDLLHYIAPDNRNEAEWISSLRKQIARATISKLYKVFRDELIRRLTKDSNAVAARSAANAFSNLLRMRPFESSKFVAKELDKICDDCRDDRVIREAVRRKMGYFNVLSVIIEKLSNGYRTHCVVVGHRGDMLEHVWSDALLSPGMDAKLKESDRTRIGALIDRHLVSLISIGVDDRKARGALAEFKSIVGEKLDWKTDAWTYLSMPEIAFGDLVIPTRVSKMMPSASVEQETGYSIRLAMSLGRYQQNPCAEILSLWSDVSTQNNSALTVPVHDLQAFVPRPVLEREFLLVASRIVAENGVDLNDAVASAARRGLVKFIPGLGPRKARLLLESADAHLRGLDGISDQQASRPERIGKILGSCVYRNAQPFLKLVPDCDKIALYIQENGLSSKKARSYSEDSSDSSSSSSSSAPEWSWNDFFGIPNSIVSVVLEGYSFFETCRFGRDCWPAAKQLLSLSLDDKEPRSLFAILGDASTASILHSFNPTSLIDEMFDNSSDQVPGHLTDSEIDSLDLKEGTGRLFGSVVIPQLTAPFDLKDLVRSDWRGPTKFRLFFAMVKENPFDLNKWTVTTCTVTEQSSGKWIKVTDTASGLEGWLTKGYNDSARYYEGDSLTCRVTDIDMIKLGLTFSTEPITEGDMRSFTKYSFYSVWQRSDFSNLENLGKVEIVQRSVVKSRRIIKHESFFEIPHGAAVEKLLDLPVGEVVFRPSNSQPGVYFGLIKIGTPSSDPSREDWIKVVRFTEGPSSRSTSGKSSAKTVFKLMDFGGADEFEEFDQMKVVYVDKYMRYLSELRSHPKFRPEHLDQVRNMLLAKMRTAAQSSVAYSVVMDPRREFAGNALLLWAADGNKVHEDVVEITHRGFRWWTKGPYPSLNALLTWWKQGGYKERPLRSKEWVDEQSKKGPQQ